MLDADLAALYGVTVRRLNEIRILKSQFATSSWGGKRKPPLAFNEHGAFMAATVLNSARAVEMSIYVVRAFVKLRQVLASNTEFAHKLEALERSVATLDARTRKQFEEVYRAIRALMAPPAAKARPIGFTADLD